MIHKNQIQTAPSTGRLLNDYFKKKRIRKSALSRSLNRHISSLRNFLANDSIQTNALWDISMALKHNFFRDIADKLPPEFTTEAIPDTTATERIAALELEVTILKAEKEVLIRAMRE